MLMLMTIPAHHAAASHERFIVGRGRGGCLAALAAASLELGQVQRLIMKAFFLLEFDDVGVVGL